MRNSVTRHVAGVTLLSCTCLTAAACGSGSSSTPAAAGSSAVAFPSSSSAAPSVATAAAANHADAKKPCSLVTLADANQAMGLTLDADVVNQEIAGINVNCTYNDSKGHRVQITVAEDPESVDQLTQFASHGATKVPGVGDNAYWNPSASTISVSSHDVGFVIGVFDDHLTMGDAKAQAAATSLAKTAAGRLG